MQQKSLIRSFQEKRVINVSLEEQGRKWGTKAYFLNDSVFYTKQDFFFLYND